MCGSSQYSRLRSVWKPKLAMPKLLLYLGSCHISPVALTICVGETKRFASDAERLCVYTRGLHHPVLGIAQAILCSPPIANLVDLGLHSVRGQADLI